MTLGDALTRIRDRLRTAGISNSGLESRWLVAGVLGLDDGAPIIGSDRRLEASDWRRLDAAAARRVSGEPLSRILGRRGFWTFDVALSPDTLDPRPDSECIVAAALSHIPEDRPWRVLDLGTGTGCLLLAILRERPMACGLGVDISAEAVSTARLNARRLGVGDRFSAFAGCWADALAGSVDMIISNPPYIETAVIDTLDDTVRRYDPGRALDGGADGLAAYRALAPAAKRLLTDDGVVLVEIGQGQAFSVCTVLAAAGLVPQSLKTDYSGIQRCVIAKKKLELPVTDGTVRQFVMGINPLSDDFPTVPPVLC